jgi:hypothetical protein
MKEPIEDLIIRLERVKILINDKRLGRPCSMKFNAAFNMSFERGWVPNDIQKLLTSCLPTWYTIMRKDRTTLHFRQFLSAGNIQTSDIEELIDATIQVAKQEY